MSRLKYILLLMLFVLPVSVCCLAADEVITDHLKKSGKITINQPEELYNRLNPKTTEAVNQDSNKTVSDTEEKEGENKEKPKSKNPVGYRIQVYSDNNPKTARTSAKNREHMVLARFPQHKTYVQYKSPMWRVRVGNFSTRKEAEAAAADIRRAFPAFRSEIKVVMDRINPAAL